MTTILILLPCNVRLDCKDNLLETIVNLLDFYWLNLWRILLGGLGWSSHTVIVRCQDFLQIAGRRPVSPLNDKSCVNQPICNL